MKLSEKIGRLYFNRENLSEIEMARSRNLSVYEGCTARSILTLTSGSFLVGFAGYLGASDQIAGIVSAIPVFAGIITVFSPLMFERMANRKFITILFCLLGRLMLGTMIVIPFIDIPNSQQIALLIGMFLTANLFLAAMMPSATTWLLKITPESIRGAYYGRREAIVLGAVTIVTLVMGQVLDKFDRAGYQLRGFIILYIFVIIITLVNFIIFSGMKEPPNEILKTDISVINIFRIPLKNKKYMTISILMAVWNFGYQLAFPFTSVYMVSTLKLGYGLITIMAVLASLTSVVSVYFWGRLADRKSWLYLMNLMILIQITSFFIWFFINKSTAAILLPLAHILGGAAIGGINISLNNLQYTFSPPDNKTVFLGFSSAVNGVIGFTGTLAGSYFLTLSEKLEFKVWNLSVGSMQMIFLIAGITLFSGVVFVHNIMKSEAFKVTL